MKELIGKECIDKDGAICKILDATVNSVNIWIGAKTKNGIDSTGWWSEKYFNERFKFKSYDKET